WYQSNATQPERDQPWYHVLVHRSPHCTYAAAENLQPDHDAEPILHPWIDHFFSSFVNGRYVRNDRPWPEWT
ncbi:MAG: heat shock protein HspQ, partial [Phycisphaerae bacterium]|nr:heat shock protein HspQ [Phycisphaerae bacterium]